MLPIPRAIRLQLEQEALTAVCARRSDGGCYGRLTVEHAYGRIRQERWMLLWLCWYHHLGNGLDKQKNKWLALNQATETDLTKYPKCTEAWKQELKYLNSIYG